MAAPPSTGAQNAGAKPPVNPWIIAISVMLATFMEVLDTAIASVALPYIAGSLSASNDEASWVLTSYLVANAIILPASNWFSLKFGRKRFLISCVIIFTISSFFCGAAPSLGLMLLARIIQGAGGGALQPLSQAILLESFPPAKRGAAMAFFAFGIVVAPVIGPTLGGWLTDTYSWRYAFYINIPVGALAVYMIGRFVQDPPHIKNAKPGAFDGLGFSLLTVWIGALQVVLDRGQEDDWFSAIWIRWAVGLCVIALVWFIVHSWRSPNPLVKLKTLRDWNFCIGCILIGMFGIAIYSLVTVLPLFFQDLLAYTAFTAGMAVGPRGFGSIVGMPVIAYLGSRVDPRILLTFGFSLYGCMALIFGNLTLGLGPWTLLVPVLASGFALSFVFVPITTQAYGTLKNTEIGNASGIFNLTRNIGGSIGISVAQTLLTRRADHHQNEILNYVPTSSIWFQDRINQMTQYLAHQTNPANATRAAQQQIYKQLGDQSLLWAFVDVFRWLSLICFLGVGIVWLFKKVKPGAKAPAGAH